MKSLKVDIFPLDRHQLPKPRCGRVEAMLFPPKSHKLRRSALTSSKSSAASHAQLSTFHWVGTGIGGGGLVHLC